jgi:hypothetical protein
MKLLFIEACYSLSIMSTIVRRGYKKKPLGKQIIYIVLLLLLSFPSTILFLILLFKESLGLKSSLPRSE